MQQMPGGLWRNGRRVRDFSFRPVDGALELTIAEAALSSQSTAAAVTQALACSLADLAEAAPTPERVRELCVGDRQFLMRQLSVHMGHNRQWLSSHCRQCRAPFDFQIEVGRLPVREAHERGDRVEVLLDGQTWHFRLPNGEDQEQLARAGDARALLKRCVQSGSPEALDTMPDSALETIDSALEAAAPQVVTEVQAPCPECEANNTIALDPYELLNRPSEQLLTEVHQIAMHYHWSEQAILALPRPRRAAYLKLIDRARGLSQ